MTMRKRSGLDDKARRLAKHSPSSSDSTDKGVKPEPLLGQYYIWGEVMYGNGSRRLRKYW